MDSDKKIKIQEIRWNSNVWLLVDGEVKLHSVSPRDWFSLADLASVFRAKYKIVDLEKMEYNRDRLSKKDCQILDDLKSKLKPKPIDLTFPGYSAVSEYISRPPKRDVAAIRRDVEKPTGYYVRSKGWPSSFEWVSTI